MTSEPTRAQQLEFARKIALKLLEARSRSEAELRAKLAAKNVPEDVSNELICRFQGVGLLDDASYAQALVATRAKVDRHGRARIRQELRARGVEREVAEQALDQLSPEQEWEAALGFAQRRAKTLAGLEPLVVRRRLYQALARRGYGLDTTQRVIDEVLGYEESS